MAEPAPELNAPDTKPGPRMNNPIQSQNIWSRRSFFGLAGWASIAGVFGIWGFAATRFIFPRVLFEPASWFKAGTPDSFTADEVHETFKDTNRVWIVREADGGFFALLAICTHLGCTPRWLPLEQKFKCPCHGSGFKRDGVNFEGPAPRALERVKIVLADDGQILIDKAVKYLREKGDWEKKDAKLEANELPA